VLILYIIAVTVRTFLSVVSLAMFVRALVSLFVMEEENKFLFFLSCITEPFITPFRFLLSNIPFVRESPIDISFTVAFFAVIILQRVLPVPVMP